MRFVVTGEWERNAVLRVILGFFLVFALLLWVTNFVLYFGDMSLRPASVVAFYLGDERTFRQPRSLRGLAEVAHAHLFGMGILVLTLAHLLLFLPVNVRVKLALVVAAFTSALLNEGAGWLVRFVHPSFAIVKVAAFVALQAALGALIALAAVGVIRPTRSAY